MIIRPSQHILRLLRKRISILILIPVHFHFKVTVPPIGISTGSRSMMQSYATSSSDTTNNHAHHDWPHPIYASERITDRKSIFLAHASILPSQSALPTFLEHLTALPSLKRATHCMYAYRTSLTSPLPQTVNTRRGTPAQDQVVTDKASVIAGQNDGGEGGSGDRLARLLELSLCENVIVVVSRWYGGVPLGNDRWKRISDVAKQALERGGFFKNRDEIKGSKTKDKGKGKGKKKR